MTGVMHQQQRTNGRVQSLNRGLEILDILARTQHPVTVGALARELKISPSAVSRLAATLRDHGLIEQASPAGPYTLGLSLLRYARTVSREHPAAYLGERAAIIARTLGETVSISIPVDDGVLYIYSEMPAVRAVQLRIQVGAVLPYHCTASGKIFLAAMPQEQLDALLARGLRRRTTNTTTSRETLLAELELVRSQGYAAEFGESSISAGCVAVPVRGTEVEPLVALSCTAGVHSLTPARVEQIRAELQRAAREIERESG